MLCLLAGSSGETVDNTPGDICQGSEVDFPSIRLFPATQHLLPFCLTKEQRGCATCHLPLSPVLLLDNLSKSRSDLCKTFQVLKEAYPCSPFCKTAFYQHFIRSCFLALGWHVVSLWPGLFYLPAVAVSQTVSHKLLVVSLLQRWSVITWLLTWQVLFPTARSLQDLFTVTRE